MNWYKRLWPFRVYFFLSVLVTCIALIAAVAFIPYALKWDLYASTVQKTGPRIERLSGLKGVELELSDLLTAYSAELHKVSYPPDKSPDEVQGILGTRVRQIVDGAGLSLVSMSQLPVRPDGAYERLSVSMNLQGTLPQIQVFLVALDDFPKLWTSKFVVRLGRVQQDSPQNLAFEVVIFALRRTSDKN